MLNKLILVTGAHRSGSTWIGKIISKAPNVRYVHEPFNIGIRRDNSPLTFWFEYLDHDTELEKQDIVKRYLNSFYKLSTRHLVEEVLEIRGLRGAYSYLSDLKRRITDRIVFKDPLAIMSAEWFAYSFKADVVVSIRHPAAFVASLKVKNWTHDFNHFKKQHALMKKHLYEFSNLIDYYCSSPPDIISHGILLWNIIYSRVNSYRNKYNNIWYFVRHEDLSKEPVREFKQLFDFLNIKFTNEVENEILDSTQAESESDLRRKSISNIYTWKERLTSSEINRIRIGTEKISKLFYNEADWD